MTRINTNVGSLVAQNRLQSSNKDLNSALTRLSTGLRINKGSDDPAGLIASEALRSEVTSLSKSISNTNRASQIISTADSALSEVSNLLNDVRGLVVEAANSGALSKEEIAANQLQIDSSLEAINRIAQSTTFQGRKLLDGSLDFKSNAGSVDSIKDITIDQANLGATGKVDVEVVISEAAKQAEATASSAAFTTKSNATVDSGITFGSSTLTLNTDELVDVVGEGLTSVAFVDDTENANSGEASYDADTGVLTITANFTGATGTGDQVNADADATDIFAAINAIDGLTAVNGKAEVAGVQPALVAGSPAASTASTVVDEGDGLTITATEAGSDFNNVAVKFASGASNSANFDSVTKELTITTNGAIDSAALKTLVEGATKDGSAAASPLFDADVVENSSFSSLGTADALDTGVTGGETLLADVVFQLNGADGAETFNFGGGTSADQIAAAVNLVSDSTGVSADSSEGLKFSSTAYGSSASVNIEIISEGAGGVFESNLDSTSSVGTDISATVNGVEANGDGNKLSINTSTLDLSLTVDSGSDTNFNFAISGGGARFQLGPDVVSTQQASIGIGSVSTGQLGGASGRLYELGTGQAKSLTNDVTGAAEVIDEVISKVTSLRGRLGAFQSTTLDSNLTSLNETRANLSEAQSSIRDADFAEESAKLTRAQILVQSGTNVLSLANQSPQNVLSLIR